MIDGLKQFLYGIWARFLTWFGQVKVLSFHLIPVLAQDSEGCLINGNDILQIMEIVKPGDVLIRGFNEYLDGRFIPDEHGYSHAGLYIGECQMIHAASPEVQWVNIIDFCQCDRVMVLRPSSGSDDAVQTAKSLLGTPYDFDYTSDEDRLYCFELVNQCYLNSEMQTYDVSKFLGLVKKQCYLAKSIYENPFFEKVWEKNDR